MKKLETIIKNTIGRIDTPKKLNRSTKTVPQELVDKIEDGNLDHETLKALTKNYPTFWYQTCLTIHGNWPEVAIKRIGGYRNIIQNKNGSLEVRWTAIDTERKKNIHDLLYLLKSKYHLKTDSQGSTVSRSTMVTKETFEAKKAEMMQAIDRIKNLNIYGGYNLGLYNYWGANYLVLEIAVSSIPQGQDLEFVCSLEQVTEAQIEARKAEKVKEDLERKAEQEQRREAQKAKVQDLTKAIECYPLCEDLTKGILVKVVQTAKGFAYKFYKQTETGSFGRIKYATGYSTTPDLPELTERPKQEKLNDIVLTGARLFKTIHTETPPKQPTAGPTPKAKKPEIQIVNYSDKALAIIGDTKPLKDHFKRIGARFNPYLHIEGGRVCGWIVPKSRKNELTFI